MESPTSTVPKTSDSSFSDTNRLLESTSESGQASVEVEATSNSVSDVKTKTPGSAGTSSVVTGDHSRGTIAPSDKETDNIASVRATVSPTLSAESLLSDDTVSDTISLVTEHSDGDSVQSSQQTSLSASSS